MDKQHHLKKIYENIDNLLDDATSDYDSWRAMNEQKRELLYMEHKMREQELCRGLIEEAQEHVKSLVYSIYYKHQRYYTYHIDQDRLQDSNSSLI